MFCSLEDSIALPQRATAGAKERTGTWENSLISEMHLPCVVPSHKGHFCYLKAWCHLENPLFPLPWWSVRSHIEKALFNLLPLRENTIAKQVPEIQIFRKKGSMTWNLKYKSQETCHYENRRVGEGCNEGWIIEREN